MSVVTDIQSLVIEPVILFDGSLIYRVRVRFTREEIGGEGEDSVHYNHSYPKSTVFPGVCVLWERDGGAEPR